MLYLLLGVYVMRRKLKREVIKLENGDVAYIIMSGSQSRAYFLYRVILGDGGRVEIPARNVYDIIIYSDRDYRVVKAICSLRHSLSYHLICVITGEEGVESVLYLAEYLGASSIISNMPINAGICVPGIKGRYYITVLDKKQSWKFRKFIEKASESLHQSS